MGGFELI